MKSLFAATSEDAGVAPLDPGYGETFPGEIHQELVYLGLLHVVLAPALAHIEPSGVWGGEPEDLHGYEIVVDHGVAFLKDAPGLDRDELRVSGTRPDEVDFHETLPLCMCSWSFLARVLPTVGEGPLRDIRTLVASSVDPSMPAI
ncbi:MAG: hypothetical protein BWX71_01799 [Deltaproteobacteria bacterium ADurb.Bin072]|nr:MAG: hypothetical protein BWX71_01799 [Deltaproteobacteria bacterium ADurb.Bin072]